MAKIELETISSGFQSSSAKNANNVLIEDALNNKVLYRDNPVGEANQMESTLDMNSNRIINLPTAISSAEAVSLGQLMSLLAGYAGGVSGDPDENLLQQIIVNNIALGVIFNQNTDFTAASTMAYAYTRIIDDADVDVSFVQNDILIGSEIHIRNAGTGTVTLIGSGGVTLNPPAGGTLVMGGEGATITAKKISTTEWDVIGQVVAV